VDVTFPWQLEPWIRLGAFAGVLALLAVAELLAPRRRQAVSRAMRWPANLGWLRSILCWCG
jgi:hypothetical protein